MTIRTNRLQKLMTISIHLNGEMIQETGESRAQKINFYYAVKQNERQNNDSTAFQTRNQNSGPPLKITGTCHSRHRLFHRLKTVNQIHVAGGIGFLFTGSHIAIIGNVKAHFQLHGVVDASTDR